MVVIQGKPDILKNTSSTQQKISADQLLDLNDVKEVGATDSDFLVSLDFSKEPVEEPNSVPAQGSDDLKFLLFDYL